MRIWRALREHADAAFAVGLLVALETELWLASYAEHRPLLAIAAVVAALPLVWRGRFPLTAVLVVWVGLVLMKEISPGFDEHSTIFIVVGVFSLYSLGANARGVQAWIGAAFVLAVTVQFIGDDGDRFMWGDIVFGAFIMGGPWFAGVMMRFRRDREQRLEQEKAQAEAAIVDERARIARELHDVVAHASR